MKSIFPCMNLNRYLISHSISRFHLRFYTQHPNAICSKLLRSSFRISSQTYPHSIQNHRLYKLPRVLIIPLESLDASFLGCTQESTYSWRKCWQVKPESGGISFSFEFRFHVNRGWTKERERESKVEGASVDYTRRW